MYIVRHLLQQKGRQVWTLPPRATVYEALELMASKNLGALVIVEQDRVVGIFSERDYARRVVLKGRASRTTLLGDVMTRAVLYVGPDDTIENCMALMTEHRLRHLPVLEDGQLAGIVSIGDVVKAIITHQKVTIENLENYIMGKYQ